MGPFFNTTNILFNTVSRSTLTTLFWLKKQIDFVSPVKWLVLSLTISKKEACGLPKVLSIIPNLFRFGCKLSRVFHLFIQNSFVYTRTESERIRRMEKRNTKKMEAKVWLTATKWEPNVQREIIFDRFHILATIQAPKQYSVNITCLQNSFRFTQPNDNIRLGSLLVKLFAHLST